MIISKGRAHIVAVPAIIEKMRPHPRIAILTETDMGDGTVICLIETDFITEGYRGVCDAIMVGGDFKFVRDADV